jgi:hypothetical protein
LDLCRCDTAIGLQNPVDGFEQALCRGRGRRGALSGNAELRLIEAEEHDQPGAGFPGAHS